MEIELTLRHFRPEDQERMLETLTDTTVNKTYMLPDFEKKEDASPLFEKLMGLSLDEGRFVRCISLEGTAIGFMNDVVVKDGGMELGYVIHPDSQGKGYMTQALKMAIAELFEKGFAQVFCGAFEENKASLHVMEKAGMQPMDFTEVIEYRGKSHLCLYRSICKE